MPELAEVAYFANRWKVAIGQSVESVELHPPSRVFRQCNAAALRSGLAGSILQGIRTHGKQALFEFSGGQWLLVHLGMTGSLRADTIDAAKQKHDHLILLTVGHSLVFNDPRQFGSVQHGNGGLPDIWTQLPPQPFEKAFTVSRLGEILTKHPRTPLKSLLLEQRHFPGIGNWMADEVMWQMRLHPETPAGTLTPADVTKLNRILRKVCAVAMKTIGVDWRDPPKSWLFVHRWEKGTFCPRCKGALEKSDLRGRTACWCPVCQPKPQP